MIIICKFADDTHRVVSTVGDMAPGAIRIAGDVFERRGCHSSTGRPLYVHRDHPSWAQCAQRDAGDVYRAYWE